MGSATELLRMEHALNSLVKRFPVVALCVYDIRHFDTATIFEGGIKAHPDLFELGVQHFLP
jgi:hypothetical protein